MSPLEVGLLIVVAILAVALAIVGVAQVMGRGDPELRSIRKERQANEQSAYSAALKASEQISSASAVGREVRHTRRFLAAQDLTDRQQRELDALGTGAPGGNVPPPPPPPHP